MCNLAWLFLGAFIGSTVTLTGMLIIWHKEENSEEEKGNEE